MFRSIGFHEMYSCFGPFYSCDIKAFIAKCILLLLLLQLLHGSLYEASEVCREYTRECKRSHCPQILASITI